MRVISKPVLHAFAESHPQARNPLEDWYDAMLEGKWKNSAELREHFPSADQVRRCTVFNVGGNKYRLITRVNYRAQIVFVGFVLTHEEYNLEKWKGHC